MTLVNEPDERPQYVYYVVELDTIWLGWFDVGDFAFYGSKGRKFHYIYLGEL